MFSLQGTLRSRPTRKEDDLLISIAKCTLKSALLRQVETEIKNEIRLKEEEPLFVCQQSVVYFSFFMRDLYDALYFRIHMTVLKSTHWGSQTGSAIGDHLIKEHDMEPDDWHRTEFEHPRKFIKKTSVSYFWNAFCQRNETTAKQTMWLNPCEVIILDCSLNLTSRLLNDTTSKPNGGFTWAVGLKEVPL